MTLLHCSTVLHLLYYCNTLLLSLYYCNTLLHLRYYCTIVLHLLYYIQPSIEGIRATWTLFRTSEQQQQQQQQEEEEEESCRSSTALWKPSSSPSTVAWRDRDESPAGISLSLSLSLYLSSAAGLVFYSAEQLRSQSSSFTVLALNKHPSCVSLE